MLDFWLSKKFYKPEYDPVKDVAVSTEEMKQDPREAFFKAVDAVMKHGNARECYKYVYSELYKDEAEAFVKNMIQIRYDGMVFNVKGSEHFIVFNPKCIQIIKQ